MNLPRCSICKVAYHYIKDCPKKPVLPTPHSSSLIKGSDDGAYLKRQTSTSFKDGAQFYPGSSSKKDKPLLLPSSTKRANSSSPKFKSLAPAEGPCLCKKCNKPHNGPCAKKREKLAPVLTCGKCGKTFKNKDRNSDRRKHEAVCNSDDPRRTTPCPNKCGMHFIDNKGIISHLQSCSKNPPPANK